MDTPRSSPIPPKPLCADLIARHPDGKYMHALPFGPPEYCCYPFVNREPVGGRNRQPDDADRSRPPGIALSSYRNSIPSSMIVYSAAAGSYST